VRRAALRAAVVLAAALVSVIIVVLTTGLATTSLTGAEDNGDGRRLYCGAGLLPDAPSDESSWMGGVIVEYDVEEPCDDPIPSTALTMIRLAMQFGPDSTEPGSTWTLDHLGWLYVGGVALITALGAWAATAGGLWRVVMLAPGLVPLADTDLSRFFLSTYGEPAGLLGTLAVVTGTAAVLATKRTDRLARGVAVVLVASGGLFAVGAKVAYAPVLLAAFVVCACTAVGLTRSGDGWSSRIVGPVLAGLLIIGGAPTILAGIQWQERNYADVNVHNLIYTAVLPEIPDAARILGLPPEASQYAGRPLQVSKADKPGLAEIAADPEPYRMRAIRLLLVNPDVLGKGMGLALQATQGRDLRYLNSAPWEPGAQFLNKPTTSEEQVLSAGQQSATADAMEFWLARQPLPWLPSTLVVVAVLAGAWGLWFRRVLASGFAVLAGFAALTATGLAAAALGDGYFELAKHVWLASYLIDVAALSLAGMLLLLPLGVVKWANKRFRPPQEPASSTQPEPVPAPTAPSAEPESVSRVESTLVGR
jgi:hypothetical protein